MKMRIMSQSITYKVENGRILGLLSPLESLIQTIHHILRTERGKYNLVIAEETYGVEVEDLFGMNPIYAYPRLQYTIREALLQDDRIQEVMDFKILSHQDNAVEITMTLQTTLEEQPILSFQEVITL